MTLMVGWIVICVFLVGSSNERLSRMKVIEDVLILLIRKTVLRYPHVWMTDIADITNANQTSDTCIISAERDSHLVM